MAEQLRIKRLKFKAGSKPGFPGLEVDVPNVTVLVGPNNAGKSQTLRELETWCQGKNATSQVIDDIQLMLPDSADEVRSLLERHQTEPPENQAVEPGQFWVARTVVRHGEKDLHIRISEDELKRWFDTRNIEKNFQHLRRVFVQTYTLRLDGRTRFDLVEPKDSGPLEKYPKNHLWALFVDDEAREKVRQFTEDAFGKHFVIDPTAIKQFRVRLAGRKPETKEEEQGLHKASRDFHRDAPLVSTLGDGVRTSVGLVSAVMSLPHRILLIDEPEAFLHPTLARRVGRVLSKTARERKASLVVATHSAEFLMGCIQAAPELRLVRLTYADNQSTARSLEPTEIVTLMNDPLLRSANALRALYHRGVIVTEADADRAFYEEINYRLQQNGRGIEDGLFMNAQNWQTIPRIVAPLRLLGIPAAAIFDFDVLMDQDFHHIWPLLHAEEADLQALQKARNSIKDLTVKQGRAACKSLGIGLFKETEKRLVEAFINEMTKFGIFFVGVGELECWLANLGVVRISNKPKWLTNMFTRLGSDASCKSYVLPDHNDVWAFIEKVEDWIKDPMRDGMPS